MPSSLPEQHPETRLPLIPLRAGDWTALVFDPRPDPLALGPRYVNGGYVQSLWQGERCLTGRASAKWDSYIGEGLPEVFEYPLGFHTAQESEYYLRIGAGQLRRDGRSYKAGGVSSKKLIWQVEQPTANHLVMRTHDAVTHNQNIAYGYLLEREILLEPGHLISRSTLRLEAPWSHPLVWFAHPFFPQSQGDATQFVLPAGAECLSTHTMVEGPVTLPADGGLLNYAGLWGNLDPMHVDLDPAMGGGRVSISMNRPWDHLVLYASKTAASPEPQLARSWKNGEKSSWQIEYRFAG